MADVVIRLRGLSKQYSRTASPTWHFHRALTAIIRGRYRRPWKVDDRNVGKSDSFWALRDVTLDVERGERVGVIGRNGAGKSTLLKILSRIVYPTAGEARIRGRVTPLLEVGTGFNPRLTGRENVYLNASIHGLNRREIDACFDDIVGFAEIADFIDTPLKHYSSGMFMRLAFSVAAHLDPDILLLDEVLAVGDISFQQKCLSRVETLTSGGRTVLFVSHSMDAIARFCTRCLWIDQGRVVRDGAAVDVVNAYLEEVFGVRSSRVWVPDAATAAHDAPAIGPDSESEAGSGATSHAPNARDPGIAGESDIVPDPGIARLVSARIVNGAGQTTTSVATDEPVGVEVVFDVLRDGKNVQPALHFKTAQDAYAFVVAYTDPQHMRSPRTVGRYQTIAWLPPHLLNAGPLFVTIALVIPDPLQRLAEVERALSFNVTESVDVEGGARGMYGKAFPGVIRPRLPWQTYELTQRDGSTLDAPRLVFPPEAVEFARD
jgi:lipopolysaccharide transport system ATP-binding protein